MKVIFDSRLHKIDLAKMSLRNGTEIDFAGVFDTIIRTVTKNGFIISFTISGDNHPFERDHDLMIELNDPVIRERYISESKLYFQSEAHRFKVQTEPEDVIYKLTFTDDILTKWEKL